MNTRFLFIGICMCPVAHVLGQVHSDQTETIRILALDLEVPVYAKSNLARNKLILLLNSRDQNAKDAAAILENFRKRRIEWLVQVGNDRSALEEKRPPTRLRVALDKATAPHEFKYLLGIPTLRVIGLSGKAITDDHLAVLSQMPSLGLLDVSNTSITGAQLDRLHLPSLEILRINNSPLSDEGICKADFPKLTVLDVSGTSVTGNAILRSKLNSIRELNVQQTNVDGAGLMAVSRYPKLTTLRVDIEQLNPDVVEVIKGTLLLHSLHIACAKGHEDIAERLVGELPGDGKVKVLIRSK